MGLLDFEALSFDCYGTLIDWESGLRRALAETLPGGSAGAGDLLEAFARLESEEEAAAPALPYSVILARVHARLAGLRGLPADARAAATFAASVGDWPPFPDSHDALLALGRRFRLAVLSNVDRASFAASRARLGVDFDLVCTAEEIGSYKPDPRNFELLLARLAERGVVRERVLHVAQSLYHDHLPARRLGLATCWIDRRAGTPGWGATPPPPAPVTPDFTFPTLAALAAAVEAEAGVSGTPPAGGRS
jgi:2-haloalkanoic acid dehalogenase type II